MIKNPIKRPAGKVFAVLLVLGLAACLFPVNLAAFAFSNGQSASIVLGQSSFTTNAAPTPPTAASENFPNGIAFDSAGNFWVADASNSRSLEYLGPVVPPSVSVPEFPVGGMALLLVVSAAAYAVIRYRAISPSSLRISA